MNTLEDLRQVFDQQLRHAPDQAGVLETVHAKGKRLRARRRGMAALGIVALVASILAVPIPRPGPPEMASGLVIRPLRMSAGWTEGGDVKLKAYGVNGTSQYLRVSGGLTTNSYYIFIRVETGDIELGDPVAIPGRQTTGYYLPELENTGVAVGWRHPSGLWIVVLQARPPYEGAAARLAAVIPSVTIGEPALLRASFRLGYVPANLSAVFAHHSGDNPGIALADIVGFNPGGVPAQVLTQVRETEGTKYRPTWSLPTKLALTVHGGQRDERFDRYDGELGPPQRIGGQEVWILKKTTGFGPIVPAGGTVIVVRDARCRASLVIADDRLVPEEQQMRMVESFRLNDCTNPATWTPLSG